MCKHKLLLIFDWMMTFYSGEHFKSHTELQIAENRKSTRKRIATALPSFHGSFALGIYYWPLFQLLFLCSLNVLRLFPNKTECAHVSKKGEKKQMWRKNKWFQVKWKRELWVKSLKVLKWATQRESEQASSVTPCISHGCPRMCKVREKKLSHLSLWCFPSC